MRQRDRIVIEVAKSAGAPLAWDLAGGYQVPVSKVVALHVATMEECMKTYGVGRRGGSVPIEPREKEQMVES